MNTNLLPEEFVLARMVEAKKPWLLSAVGAVMLGCVIMLIMNAAAKYRVDPDNKQDQISWKEARAEVQPVASESAKFKTEDDELNTKLKQINAINAELTSASETQTDWMELISAIYQMLPKDPRMTTDTTDLPFNDREELYLDYFETKYFDDLRPWYISIQPIYDYQFQMVGLPNIQELATVYAKRTKNLKAPPATTPAPTTPANPKQVTLNEVLTGPGWVVELRGYHFHNSTEALDKFEAQEAFIVKYFLKKMITENVKLDSEEFALSDFGVFYPTLVQYTEKTKTSIPLPDATAAAEETANATEPGQQNSAAASNPTPNSGNAPNPQSQNPSSRAAESSSPPKKSESAERCDFTIQFAWIPRSRKDRLLARELRLKAETAAVATATPTPNPAAPNAAANPTNTTPPGAAAAPAAATPAKQ